MKIGRFRISNLPLILSVFLMLSFNAWGATHYFASSGDDDTGNGTIGTPWKTVTKANSECGTGDTCYFNRGDTWANSLLTPPDGPVTFGAYGTGNKPIIAGTGAQYAMIINAKSGVTLQDIEFRNAGFGVAYVHGSYAAVTSFTSQRCAYKVTGTGGADVPVFLFYADNSLSGITFDSNEITNSYGGDGIRFETSSLPVFDVTLSNNTIHDITGGNGINFFGDKASTIGAEGTPGDPFTSTAPAYGIDIKGNTITGTTYSAIRVGSGFRYVADHPNYIRNNIASEIGTMASPNVNAFQLNFIVSTIVEKNTITNVYTSAPDGDGIILDMAFVDPTFYSKNLTVRKNRITGCNASAGRTSGINAIVVKDSEISFNIVTGNQIGISLTTGYPTGNTFYNNSIENNAYGIVLTDATLNEGYPPASTWKNNKIFNNSSHGIFTQVLATNPTESYNSFSGNGVNFLGSYTQYPNAGSFPTTHEADAATTIYGSRIALSGAQTISRLGAYLVNFAQTECWAALYSSDGTTRLAYGKISSIPTSDWADVLVNYSAAAGTYWLFVGCNGAWQSNYNTSNCATGGILYQTGVAYSYPPPASVSPDGGAGCQGVRMSYQANGTLAASDTTNGQVMDKGTALYTYAAYPGDFNGNTTVRGAAPDCGAIERRLTEDDDEETPISKCASNDTNCYNAP